jgi:hypothetical protein
MQKKTLIADTGRTDRAGRCREVTDGLVAEYALE